METLVFETGKLEVVCARDKDKLGKRAENHHVGGEEMEADWAGQEGYFRQVVWTRRENDRDGQGESQVRRHTGKGRNWKQMIRILELQRIRRSGV